MTTILMTMMKATPWVMVHQLCMMPTGSTCSPTDVKKTAMSRSRIGRNLPGKLVTEGRRSEQEPGQERAHLRAETEVAGCDSARPKATAAETTRTNSLDPTLRNRVQHARQDKPGQHDHHLLRRPARCSLALVSELSPRRETAVRRRSRHAGP